MFKQPLLFLSRAESKNKPYQRIKVVEESEDILELWDTKIRPYIIDNEPLRLDAQWDWRKNWKFANWLTSRSQQNLKIYASYIESQQGTPVLYSLMIAAQNYHSLSDRNEKATFIWWLARSPESFLKKHSVDIDNLPFLIPIKVDTAIVDSFKVGCKGHIGLHADPKGKDSLISSYKKAGMLRLNERKFIKGIRRNDGRFFYSDALTSQSLFLKYNSLR
ncbi:hypothetical protein [Vibrio sp. J383]|uniref:hypothetical protein n=1 Tax=Vibrio sp. J383 TaxID=2942997 RepID=UPI0020BD8CAA|nr:hypothetical protein [Vibrio sp. J383]UQV23041.1 hypothetical protein M4S28_21070 [Vibrio sp. J383]